MRLIAAFCLCALVAAPAFAAEPATDGPMATAPQAGVTPTTTADATVRQIAAWTRAEAPLDHPYTDDRRIHGQVSVGAGTGGYREASVAAQGKVGSAHVAFAIDTVQGAKRRWR